MHFILSHKRVVKKIIALLILMHCLAIVTFTQHFEGKIFCNQTGKPLEFVNIGLIETDIGTVSDSSGVFNLFIDDRYDQESLKFSIIGYQSVTFLARELKNLQQHHIYLTPKTYQIHEVQITNSKRRPRRYGTPVTTNNHMAFAINELGTYKLWPFETGVLIDAKRQVLIRSVHINIHQLTFDKIQLKFNIYQIDEKTGSHPNSILAEPILVSLKKEDVGDTIYFDVSEYAIIVKGQILVTIELKCYEGQGIFSIRTELFKGEHFIRPSTNHPFIHQNGLPGIYFYGETVR
ncbi:carboxypeptidase-like regulatory domain-containing protein [Natronoflexus pectinivorans]|uniref:Carboxypeptidase-like protein n=1 Tax=Natronoflexus pectinivorans TaxID=682526 RepID=A0A4R2G9I0_9BACT|nr:carboxypeptidase-like regulatory domain-containing protein [Natronoflexus pectinivorans]TCO04433.1 carboxypeptidase-like protein [Natronoflexus pectinivorans]